MLHLLFSDNAVIWICAACAFRKHTLHATPLHRTAPHHIRNRRHPYSATEASSQESRDDRWMSICPRESATLSQSYSSPELPVSSDGSFVSSCSLHNDGRQPGVHTLRSLFDSQIATVVDDSSAANIVHCHGRKYGRSHSEVILHLSAETCGESKND